LFLVSLAFYSTTSKPNCWQIILADEVLPIPGGPESKTARAF